MAHVVVVVVEVDLVRLLLLNSVAPGNRARFSPRLRWFTTLVPTLEAALNPLPRENSATRGVYPRYLPDSILQDI